jgi:pre-rRNA-processing protein TSR3
MGGTEVLILRDPRESAAKCSLTPLRGMQRIRFERWEPGPSYAVGRRLLLHPDGPPLQRADAGTDLLLIDCAWRRLPQLLASVAGELLPRSLPPLTTAYPRRSKLFEDPARGLASVEALYAALSILGEPRPELLDAYRWRADFLAANPALA